MQAQKNMCKHLFQQLDFFRGHATSEVKTKVVLVVVIPVVVVVVEKVSLEVESIPSVSTEKNKLLKKVLARVF